MKKVSLIAGLMLLVAGMAWAQSDSHTVTVTVNEINAINVDNDVTLTINAATAGENPTPVSDNTTANLLWTTNAAQNAAKNIQVRTGGALPDGITLTVQAQNLTKKNDGGSTGSSAGTVTLSTTEQNFITGTYKCAGQCDLNYTASATADADVGNHVITVTYTITNS